MTQKKLIAVVVAILAVTGILLYQYLLPALPTLTSLPFLPGAEPAGVSGSIEQFAAKETNKEVSLPPPLRGKTPPPKNPPAATVPAPTLTRAGILANTNAQRNAVAGLPALAANTALDNIATARMADMFQKQYFAHVAPDGGSAEKIAKDFGYEYLAIGENIALGIFAGNADLVQAWMDSPGHRANILNSKYTELGVAAREGIFEGRNVWIAVQIFGRPAPDCPAIDADLKAAIDATQEKLAQMQEELQEMKSEMDDMQPKHGSAYNEKVDEYNALVRQYNILLDQTRLQVNKYNAQVAALNACVQAG